MGLPHNRKLVSLKDELEHWISVQASVNAGRISPTFISMNMEGRISRRSIHNFLRGNGYVRVGRGHWVKPSSIVYSNRGLEDTVQPWKCKECGLVNSSVFAQTCVACSAPAPGFKHLLNPSIRGERWLCPSCGRDCEGYEQICPRCGVSSSYERDLKSELDQNMPLLLDAKLTSAVDMQLAATLTNQGEGFTGGNADLQFTVARDRLRREGNTVEDDDEAYILSCTLKHLNDLLSRTVWRFGPASTHLNRAISKFASDVCRQFFEESKEKDGPFHSMYYLHYKKVAAHALNLTLPLFLKKTAVEQYIYQTCPKCGNLDKKRIGCSRCSGQGRIKMFAFGGKLAEKLRETKTFKQAMTYRVAELIQEYTRNPEKYEIGKPIDIKQYYRSRKGPTKQEFWVVCLASRIDLLNQSKYGLTWNMKDIVSAIVGLHAKGCLSVSSTATPILVPSQ